MKILCFGDSNTYGYDPCTCLGSRYPAAHRWVEILAQKQNWQVINLGENGREIPKREAEWLRFERMLDQQKPIDLLMIMLGTNDLLQGNAPEKVAQRMESFLRYIDLEKSKILLIGPPSMQIGEWVPTEILIDASKKLNQEYKVISERVGVGFVGTETWNIPLTFDGVHFSEDGHKRFAEKLICYLNEGE